MRHQSVVGPTPLEALSAPIRMFRDGGPPPAAAKCLCTRILPATTPCLIGRRSLPPDPSRPVTSIEVRA